MNENEEKHNVWEQGNNTVPSHILSAESWTQRKREREVWGGGVNTQAYSDSIVWFGSEKPVCKQSG